MHIVLQNFHLIVHAVTDPRSPLSFHKSNLKTHWKAFRTTLNKIFRSGWCWCKIRFSQMDKILFFMLQIYYLSFKLTKGGPSFKQYDPFK